MRRGRSVSGDEFYRRTDKASDRGRGNRVGCTGRRDDGSSRAEADLSSETQTADNEEADDDQKGGGCPQRGDDPRADVVNLPAGR